MIKSKSAGIIEAIKELRTMSLGKTLRYMYEEHLKAIRDRRAEDEYVWDLGRANGKAEAIIQILGELGEVPTELSEKIMAEKDLDTLNHWLKTAARAESLQQFEESM